MRSEVAHAFTPAGGDCLGYAPLYLYIQIKWVQTVGIQNTEVNVYGPYKAFF
jgi:hypothetical protein